MDERYLPTYYLLDEGGNLATTIDGNAAHEWHVTHETERQIGYDTHDELAISTVLCRHNQNPNPAGPARPFETFVYGPGFSERWKMHYASVDEARLGHEYARFALRSGQAFDHGDARKYIARRLGR